MWWPMAHWFVAVVVVVKVMEVSIEMKKVDQWHEFDLVTVDSLIWKVYRKLNSSGTDLEKE